MYNKQTDIKSTEVSSNNSCKMCINSECNFSLLLSIYLNANGILFICITLAPGHDCNVTGTNSDQ